MVFQVLDYARSVSLHALCPGARKGSHGASFVITVIVQVVQGED